MRTDTHRCAKLVISNDLITQQNECKICWKVPISDLTIIAQEQVFLQGCILVQVDTHKITSFLSLNFRLSRFHWSSNASECKDTNFWHIFDCTHNPGALEKVPFFTRNILSTIKTMKIKPSFNNKPKLCYVTWAEVKCSRPIQARHYLELTPDGQIIKCWFWYTFMTLT